MNITLISRPEVSNEALETLEPSDDLTVTDGEFLTTFAGRACYQAWDKKNPATAYERDYVRINAVGKGHESILEHANYSFYVTGVGRSFTHELIRHRHLSVSELSQRYVDMGDGRYVIPPMVRDALEASRAEAGPEYASTEPADYWQEQGLWEEIREGYGDIVEQLSERFPHASRKRVREAARTVLPNGQETRIVITGNLRAWRHVLTLRGALDADAEMREWAVAMLRILQPEAPGAFPDFKIHTTFESAGPGSVEPVAREYINRDWNYNG